MIRMINKFPLAAVIMLCVLATGCVTRKYSMPSPDPDMVRYDEIQQGDTVSVGDLPWGVFFKDSVLVELIGEGLSNNPDVMIAYTRVQAAEASLNIARSAYFPSIALVGQVNETLASNGKGGRKVLGYSMPQYSLGITSTWEADVWGRLRSQSRSRYADFLTSLEYVNLVRTSVISNIATSYYTLCALDEQLEITRRTSGYLLENLFTMEALMEAGMVTGAAVEQSRALYYSTIVTIPDLLINIRETENALSVLVGRPPGEILRSTLEEQQFDPFLLMGIPMVTLSRRPDVRQAELAFRSSFELTNAARASLYPSITLGTGSIVGYGASTLSSFFRPENLFANIIGAITQPVFSGRQLRGNLRIAEATEDEAYINFTKTILTAAQEVSDLLFSFYASMAKNDTRDKQIEALGTAVYFTEELLKAGEANYTEVLTALQNLLAAELNQVNDKLTQLQYSVRLYRALGGGVE